MVKSPGVGGGGYKLAHGLSLALRKQGHIADHIVCSFSFSMAGTGWAIVWDCLVSHSGQLRHGVVFNSCFTVPWTVRVNCD